MAFVLKQSDTYRWPVQVDMPVDGGRHERHTFDGEFKRITQSRVREMGELIETGDLIDSDLVREVLIGWDGVNDEDGNPIKFSQKTLDQLVDVPMLATAISKAFFESLAGAKRKN